jgi:hypothetical protein
MVEEFVVDDSFDSFGLFGIYSNSLRETRSSDFNSVKGRKDRTHSLIDSRRLPLRIDFWKRNGFEAVVVIDDPQLRYVP